MRDLDGAHHLHPLLAFLLTLEQLALPGDVTAVTLGGDVLSLCFDRLSRDDPRADRRLHGYVVELAWDQHLEAPDHRLSVSVRLVTVDDGGEGIHRLPVEKDADHDEIGGLVAGWLVVERRIPLGPRLELIEEVEDHLRKREPVVNLRPLR